MNTDARIQRLIREIDPRAVRPAALAQGPSIHHTTQRVGNPGLSTWLPSLLLRLARLHRQSAPSCPPLPRSPLLRD